MTEIKGFFTYVKELLNLALPMIMGNLGIILIGAGDVFVAAKYSTNALAAISIGNSIITIIFLFGIGLLASISPLLSNFRGAKESIKKYFLPTINFSMVLAVLSFVLILLVIPLIDIIGFEKSLVPTIKSYMFICAFSVFGAYLQVALKEYLQAYEIVLFPNFLNIIGIFIHLFLDFVFVFGWFHIPAMGAVGLAVATILSRTLFGLIMFIYCKTFLAIRKYNDFGYFINLLKIGFPIAFAVLIEVAGFNLITVLVGRVSGIYAAAQNILLTVITITFMVPMAISNAIAVKVGFSNGANNFVDVKKYSIYGITMAVGFMTICAVNFIFFPQFFIKIFTNDLTLIKICVPNLILAGFFQVFDGLQVSLGGVFKGIRKTNIILLGNFIAYWVIGLPLGMILAFNYHLNLYGFWVGLTVSIFTLALMLLIILRRNFSKLEE